MVSCLKKEKRPLFPLNPQPHRSRRNPNAFSAVLSTKGRVVGLCWAETKPQGPTAVKDAIAGPPGEVLSVQESERWESCFQFLKIES